MLLSILPQFGRTFSDDTQQQFFEFGLYKILIDSSDFDIVIIINGNNSLPVLDLIFDITDPFFYSFDTATVCDSIFILPIRPYIHFRFVFYAPLFYLGLWWSFAFSVGNSLVLLILKVTLLVLMLLQLTIMFLRSISVTFRGSFYQHRKLPTLFLFQHLLKLIVLLFGLC